VAWIVKFQTEAFAQSILDFRIRGQRIGGKGHSDPSKGLSMHAKFVAG
jgi:hypothetical protein